MDMTPGIRGMTRTTIEQDTSTGLYVVSADILVRADTASAALAQLEAALTRQADPYSVTRHIGDHHPHCNDRCDPNGHWLEGDTP